jgi:nicotinamidase-related amidase
VQAVFPGQTPVDRTTMNFWKDTRVVEAVQKTGRKKVVIAALWTEVCRAIAALSALDDGYEVYFVSDASAEVTKEAHEMAIQRMIQAGAWRVSWRQLPGNVSLQDLIASPGSILWAQVQSMWAGHTA